MAQTKTIALKKPITVHGGVATSVTLKEPVANDYFTLGEPYVLSRSKDGSYYQVEFPEVLNSYLERCLQEPKDPLVIGQLCLADSMKVKRALHDFFTEAQADSFETPAMSSSST